MHRLRRYRHPVSLLFIDLDHFKRINDVHGHAVGDRVLMQAAGILRRLYRVGDGLGRWGAEEFVVLAPNTGRDGAVMLAERLRAGLAAESFPQIGTLTASFGVAECRADDTFESWLSRGDEATYRAKHAGRSRVEVEPVPEGTAPGVERVGAGFVQLSWHVAYDSGNARLGQHRALIQHANVLLRLSLEDWPRDEVEAAVDGLLHEVAAHFEDEERLLRVAGFSGVEAHARLHRALLERVQAMGARCVRGGSRLARCSSSSPTRSSRSTSSARTGGSSPTSRRYVKRGSYGPPRRGGHADVALPGTVRTGPTPASPRSPGRC